jgi:glycosyltransferase involved in cell wall biosynthesis
MSIQIDALMVSFSIIICCYNPNQKIFSRLLSALSAFHQSSPVHEVILIDNKSDIALNSMDFVVDFINSGHNRKLVVEKEQGLTNARILGIKKSQYDWVIFFDDDNEPVSDYLIKLYSCIVQYPKVACWGPGTICVDYVINKYPDWLNTYKSTFQERSIKKCIIDNQPWWQDHYPFGTGLAVNKKVALEYIDRISGGVYSLADRKGVLLSSGGDVQMVLTAISMGFSVGIHPKIRLNHLIGSSKVTNRYLIQHAFGTASSNIPAHFEVFPFPLINLALPNNLEIIKKIYFFIKVKLLPEGGRSFKVNLAHYLGELKGVYSLRTDCKPSIFYLLLTRIMHLS